MHVFLRPCCSGILCLPFLITLTIDFNYSWILFHCIDVMRFKTGMTDDLCYELVLISLVGMFCRDAYGLLGMSLISAVIFF